MNGSEPSCEKSGGVVVTESEREMEDESYGEDPNASRAMWSCGGWAKKRQMMTGRLRKGQSF